MEWLDENYPDQVLPPLTAVFVPDDNALAAVPYIASRFGATGRVGFAALLDALFSADGSYRLTSLQAGTRNDFDRTPASFLRQKTSLLLAGPDSGSLVPSGGATAAGDFLTLVDTDTYALGLRLRGQAGTDGVMPEAWPEGRTVPPARDG